ncbi:MAG: 7-cyano-7-deazaguanine/7-aminomethyl-7-deazaguanine transporter, partial [Aliivibrio sp.]|nr:7-cyano-7-deazaguanine/7-aminomethyl-7-deazaguanine transporter [Aliivibrio sp.]
MSTFTPAQQRNALSFLVVFHLVIIASSNYLVQLPFTIFGFHTTWGAFTFPFIFLATDLTVRIFGAKMARSIIFFVMLPALAVSYFLSVVFFEGQYQGFSQLGEFNLFVARIAIASFMAYLLGQILDVHVFNRLRQLKQWWVAPT